MRPKNFFIIIFILSGTLLNTMAATTMRFNFDVAEIKKICIDSVEKAKRQMAEIVAQKKSITFSNSILAFETALAELHETTTLPLFMSAVSVNKEIRDAARSCENDVEKYGVDIFTDEKLYGVLNKFVQSSEYKQLNQLDRRLADKVILSFKRSGMALTDSKRKKVIELQKELIELQNNFAKAIAEYSDHLEVTREELLGLSDNYINALEKTPEGKYKVTMAYPHYVPFMDQAKNGVARKKLYEKYSKRAGIENVKRLESAVQIRSKISKLLGYKSHAAFVLEERMAKDPESVQKFLNDLLSKLKPLLTKEFAKMAEYKAKEGLTDKQIYDWEWRYYDHSIKEGTYKIDSEMIRKHFPFEHVTQSMFEIYQTLLGVEFREVKNPVVWHPSVRMYEVRNRGGALPIAYFYMDLFPRDGKFTHAAAFTLRSGRYDFSTEEYVLPASAIVANFAPPQKDTPTLLDHSEVETYFHEFGHIMHQILTTSRYAWFSGTRVERDFVEAPSQMLENWTWNPEMLVKLSKHYQTGKSLPKDVVARMIEARNLNVAIKKCRQILFGLFDMTIHTSGDTVHTTDLWKKLQMEVMGIPLLEGAMPQAAFGHFMGGYDAAYYGYLWSEVYATDMFDKFETEGLLNPAVGANYRSFVLSQGGTLDAESMLKNFLGRPPSTQAFLKQLGLTN